MFLIGDTLYDGKTRTIFKENRSGRKWFQIQSRFTEGEDSDVIDLLRSIESDTSIEIDIKTFLRQCFRIFEEQAKYNNPIHVHTSKTEIIRAELIDMVKKTNQHISGVGRQIDVMNDLLNHMDELLEVVTTTANMIEGGSVSQQQGQKLKDAVGIFNRFRKETQDEISTGSYGGELSLTIEDTTVEEDDWLNG